MIPRIWGFIRVVAAGPLLLGLLACPPPGILWIEAGSTASQLVFRLSERHGGGEPLPIHALTIERCGAGAGEPGEAVWKAAWTMASAPPARLIVGQAVDGYLVSGPSGPLPAACFVAHALPRGFTRFVVEANGTVTETEVDER